MSTLEELHERWNRDADYSEAYERLEPEFDDSRIADGSAPSRPSA